MEKGDSACYVRSENESSTNPWTAMISFCKLYILYIYICATSSERRVKETHRMKGAFDLDDHFHFETWIVGVCDLCHYGI